MNRYILAMYFLLIIAAVFITEFGLMYLVEEIKNISRLQEVIIDATALAVILSPIIYLFSFRILNNEICKNLAVKKKYEYLFANSPDANMTLNPPDWKFSDGNPATLELFDLNDINQLKEISPGDLSPKYQPNGKLSGKEAKRMIDLALAKGSNSFEWTHKKFNGTEFSASVMLNKVQVGQNVFLQAVVRDVTEQKRFVEALRKSAEETKKALTQSEKANKIMVGRELEMIKLKKEIASLKKPIK